MAALKNVKPDPASLLDSDTVSRLQATVNATGEGQILVHDLQVVAKSDLAALKSGEQEKSKKYLALCKVQGGASLPLNIGESLPKGRLFNLY